MDDTEFERQLLDALPKLKHFCRGLCKDDAEDVFQEAIAKALAAKDSFAHPLKMDSWLCTIARNSFFTTIKRNRFFTSFSPVGSDAPVKTPDYRVSPYERLEAKQQLAIIGRLSEEHQACMWDYLMGLSIEEIAKRNGVPEGTIRSRLSRARARYVELEAQPQAVVVDTPSELEKKLRKAARMRAAYAMKVETERETVASVRQAKKEAYKLREAERKRAARAAKKEAKLAKSRAIAA
jgi:RNA polymerase sigma-70 factor (ECF subfamily)